jgi:hypothetical protein
MLDWKILGASFAALLVVSSMFLGAGAGFGGLGDFFSGIISQISSWFSGSPFGGFFSAPSAQSKAVTLLMYPQMLELKPDSPVGVDIGKTSLTDFSGTITADYANKTLTFQEAGSSLKISAPMEEVRIAGLMISTLSSDSMKFEIVPNITSEDGALEMHGFNGTLSIREDSMEFRGNVTKLKAHIGELVWEMV